MVGDEDLAVINIPKTNDLSDSCSEMSEQDSDAEQSPKSKASDHSKMATSVHAKSKRSNFKRNNAKFEGTGVGDGDDDSL